MFLIYEMCCCSHDFTLIIFLIFLVNMGHLSEVWVFLGITV